MTHHTFTGFNIGLKAPSPWMPWMDYGPCPYCAERECRQIGMVVFDLDTFTLWQCVNDHCARLHEVREDAKRQLRYRFDMWANSSDYPDGEAGTHWEVIT